jgi:hypothetical protein
MEELMEMSKKEIDRHRVILKLKDGLITQKQAAILLNLKSDRQIRNLLTNYIKYGLQGLLSKRRKQTSNRAFKSEFKNQVMALVHERYPDFGPTLAKEKLLEYHKISISEETLRQWMIKAHLWIPKTKRINIHPSRARRELFGELIQIDGSMHHWFEERGDFCTLIVFIDDATSKITGLHFCKSECLEGYFSVLKKHILRYGRPLSLYSDRHAIFGGPDRVHQAQFKRALDELNIGNILARSPQAKGRVERVNRTLQDRLIKEMRLRGINNIEDANQFIPEFIEDFNKKFSKEPRGQIDAHRPLDSDCDLERTLTRCETRTLSKDLVFSIHSKFYKIVEPEMINRLRRKKIDIRIRIDGTFKVYYDNKILKHEDLYNIIEKTPTINFKEKMIWEPKQKTKPKLQHPWKQQSYNEMLMRKDRKVI